MSDDGSWRRQDMLRWFAQAIETDDADESFVPIVGMLRDVADHIDHVEAVNEQMQLRFILFTKVMVDELGGEVVRDVTEKAQDLDPTFGEEELEVLEKATQQIMNLMNRDQS